MTKRLALLVVTIIQIGGALVLYKLHWRFGTDFSFYLAFWLPAILSCPTYFLLLFRGTSHQPKLRKALTTLVYSLAATFALALLSFVSAAKLFGE
jgi:hypothetical protein